MAEQKQMEMLSALMGEEGQDAAKMLLRMQRLQRLLGAPQDTALPPAPQEEADVFSAQPQGKYDFRRYSIFESGISEGAVSGGAADGAAARDGQ